MEQLATVVKVPCPTVTKVGLTQSMLTLVGVAVPVEIGTVDVEGINVYLNRYTLTIVDPLGDNDPVTVECDEFIDTALAVGNQYTVYTCLYLRYPSGAQVAGQWSNNPALGTLHSVATGELSRLIGKLTTTPTTGPLIYAVVFVGLTGLSDQVATQLTPLPSVTLTIPNRNTVPPPDNPILLPLRRWQFVAGRNPTLYSEYVYKIVKRGHTLTIFTNIYYSDDYFSVDNWTLEPVVDEEWYDKVAGTIEVPEDEIFFTDYSLTI